MSRTSRRWSAVGLLGLACGPGESKPHSGHDSATHDSAHDTNPLPHDSTDTHAPDSGDTAVAPFAPQTVLLITVDTLHEGYTGLRHPVWPLMPRVQAFMDASVVLPDVYAPMARTQVALPALFLGLYPRSSGYRDDPGDPTLPWLQTRFGDAGYHTAAAVTNACSIVLVQGWDESLDLCDGVAQGEADGEAADWGAARLLKSPQSEKLFLWVHLINPHEPYDRVEPYYSAYHPDKYPGTQDFNANYLDKVMLGDVKWGKDEQAELEARYASQIAQVDERVGVVLDALEASGRADDALVMFGVDHGEDLHQHNGYIGHGCSPYLPAEHTLYAIQTPELRAHPGSLDGWVSHVDVGPTLLELAGVPWTGATDGASFAPSLLTDRTPPDRPVYFERGDGLAGIVHDGFKFFMVPTGEYAGCKPYTDRYPYRNAPEELYDLVADPGELDNLVGTDPDLEFTMKKQLCKWVLEAPWSPDDSTNAVVHACTR